MKIKKFDNNLYTQNSYLIQEMNHAVVIDPGMNGMSIASYIEENQLQLDAVLLTHAHFDHTKGLRNLAKIGTFDLYLHQDEKNHLNNPEFNCAIFFGDSFMSPQKADIHTFVDMDEISIAGMNFLVHHTPGHTIGSSCFLLGDTLFTGDTIFANGYGRADLLTGNIKDLRKSLDFIHHHFSTNTMIHPGHDASVKLKEVIKIIP